MALRDRELSRISRSDGRCASSMVRPQTVGRAFSFSGWFDRIHLSRGCVGWTTSKWR